MKPNALPDPSQPSYEGAKYDQTTPRPAETTHFQVLYTTHDAPERMVREGIPSMDLAASLKQAESLANRHAVKETFVCTVHAAFSKETTVKRAI